MKFFESLSKTTSDYIVRWNAFFWFVLTAFILYISGLGPEQISLFLFVLLVARMLALDVTKKAYQETYFSHRSANISAANPRIWTIRMDVSKAFIEEILRRAAPDKTDIWINEAYVKRHIIEEFPERIRHHYWFIKDSKVNYDELLSASDHLSYEWIDQRLIDYNAIDTDIHRIWPLASAGSGVELLLVGSWEWDPVKRRVFFRITLAVRRTGESGYRLKIDPPDIIFTIPLEPGLLGDRTGKLVTDDMGNRRKAREVEPYPQTKDGWSAESEVNGERRWHWSVEMETFERETNRYF